MQLRTQTFWVFWTPANGSIYIRYAVPPYSVGILITASIYGWLVNLRPYFSSPGIVLSRWQLSQKKKNMEYRYKSCGKTLVY